MGNQISWRVAIPAAGTILIAAIAVGIFFHNFITQKNLERLQDQQQLLLTIVQRELQKHNLDNLSQEELETMIYEWSERIQTRLTIMSEEGIPVADSAEAVSSMGNQYYRLEIRQAASEGMGESIRSGPSGAGTLYVALPLYHKGNLVGFIRSASSLTLIEQSADNLQTRIFLIGTGLALMILLQTYLISRSHLQPITLLSNSAQEIHSGNRQVFPSLHTADILAELSQALNLILRDFRNQLGTMTSESVTLRTILDQMTDGVVMIDDQGDVSLINPAAESIFQIKELNAVGHSAAEVLRQHQWIELWRASRENQTEESTSLELPAQNTFLQGFAIPLKDPLPDYTLLLFQDLSQIRSLETTRQDFISNISHELRTPLASLKALTETLQDGALEDPPAAKRFLSRIDTEVDALAQMVAELLDLTRIESGQVSLDIDPVSPGMLLSQTAVRMREQAERKNIRLQVDFDPGLPKVQADFRRIEQVLVNILHNAIKFSPRGRDIHMQAVQDDDRIVFSIADQGPGIPEFDLERIFERFYKTDQARSGGGTGLGLSISKHLIEIHEGEIWAESRINQGSVFFFSLPINRDDPEN